MAPQWWPHPHPIPFSVLPWAPCPHSESEILFKGVISLRLVILQSRDSGDHYSAGWDILYLKNWTKFDVSDKLGPFQTHHFNSLVYL